MIQAVPRPDYTLQNTSSGEGDHKKGHKASSLATVTSGGGGKIRPPKRLFDPVEAANQANGSGTSRRFHPSDRGHKYDFWNGEYYRDGFLYKDVNPATYLKVYTVPIYSYRMYHSISYSYLTICIPYFLIYHATY